MAAKIVSIAGDNLILPFQIEASGLRGRIVRLGSELNNILSAHETYPKPVLHLVGEAVTLSLLLSSMLKYDGTFTLQAQGDGPVTMVMADVLKNGTVRGCASFNAERVQAAREQLKDLKAVEDADNHLAQYLGKGHLAFTVDQEGEMERYQGIVELNGASLSDCVRHYFDQSEQIGTGIKMAVGQRSGARGNEVWRAGGVMLQIMPEEGGTLAKMPSDIDVDDWRRAMILLDSATEDELLSPELPPQNLLFRLFHEDGVRVYDEQIVRKGCRCSEDRVKQVVRMLPEDDRDFATKDGRIEMVCEFCNKKYVIDPGDIS